MEAMASKGQRVLAGATASTPDALPKDHTGFDFQFSGLVGLVATMLGLVIGLPDVGTFDGFRLPASSMAWRANHGRYRRAWVARTRQINFCDAHHDQNRQNLTSISAAEPGPDYSHACHEMECQNARLHRPH